MKRGKNLNNSFDENLNNACPSAHVCFAVYAYYIVRDILGNFIAALFPILIAYSCLKTSQHVFLDVLSAWIYTMLVYNLILKKMFPTIFV